MCKEQKKVDQLIEMVTSQFGLVKIDDKLLSEVDEYLQVIETGYNINRKKYYLKYELSISNTERRLTGFELETNCFLPIKKALFHALLK